MCTEARVWINLSGTEARNGCIMVCVACRLEYGEAKKGFKVAYQGTAPQYKLQGLQAGTSYSLRVRAVNAVGQGSWSEEASFSTTRLPPPPPTQVDCAVEADPLRSERHLHGIGWQVAAGQVGIVPLSHITVAANCLRYKTLINSHQP